MIKVDHCHCSPPPPHKGAMGGVLMSRWILLICEVDERQKALIKQPFILYRPLSSVLCPGRFLQLRMNLGS